MKKTLHNSILFFLISVSLFAFEVKTTTILNNKNNQKSTADTRPKYRIGFDAPQITHRQLLLTIDENTTDGVDWGYEGKIPQILNDDMYWIIDNDSYVIQATNTLTIDKEFALGVVTSNGGEITIKIDALENPLTDFKVALKDKDLNIIHNLEESNYKITLAAGEYHNRFSLIFLSSTTEENTDVIPAPPPGETIEEDVDNTPAPPPGDTTETNDDTTTENSNEDDEDDEEETDSGRGNHRNDFHHNHFNKQKLTFYVANGQQLLTIKNKGLITLHKITMFNKYGQPVSVWTKNINTAIVSLPVQVKSGFYFVVVQTQKGPIFKRVMIQNG